MTHDIARLDPETIHKNAVSLLAQVEPVALVSDLLRQVRQNDNTQENIRLGYEHSFKRLEEDIEITRVHAYQDVRRMIRALQPSPTTPLTYRGGLGQLDRRLRTVIRYSQVTP